MSQHTNSVDTYSIALVHTYYHTDRSIEILSLCETLYCNTAGTISTLLFLIQATKHPKSFAY